MPEPKLASDKKVATAEALMLVVAIIWGLTFVAGEWAMPNSDTGYVGFPIEWILFLRFSIASVVLSIVFLNHWKYLIHSR